MEERNVTVYSSAFTVLRVHVHSRLYIYNIIYMKKILDSDWLRAVQLKCKLPLIALQCKLLFFSCILLIGNHTISRSIWNNLHSCFCQRAQIALALRACAILILFEKNTCANYFQIDLETVRLPLLIPLVHEFS